MIYICVLFKDHNDVDDDLKRSVQVTKTHVSQPAPLWWRYWCPLAIMMMMMMALVVIMLIMALVMMEMTSLIAIFTTSTSVILTTSCKQAWWCWKCTSVDSDDCCDNGDDGGDLANCDVHPDVHYLIMMVRRCRLADSPIKDLKILVMVIMMIMLSFLYKSRVLALSINIHSTVSNDGVGFYRSAA